jgi:hypothetical protein
MRRKSLNNTVKTTSSGRVYITSKDFANRREVKEIIAKKPKNMTKLTKVSMNLSQKSMDNVEELSKLIQESNRTRVVASALGVAKAIIKQVLKGNHIIIRDNNGNEKEMNFIIE